MRWGPEGFALICAGTKGMIRALRAAEPELRPLLERGVVGLGDLASVGYDYEVIP
jgi:hypothetical protein